MQDGAPADEGRGAVAGAHVDADRPAAAEGRRAGPAQRAGRAVPVRHGPPAAPTVVLRLAFEIKYFAAIAHRSRIA